MKTKDKALAETPEVEFSGDYQLKKPVEFEGTTHTSVHFDFTALSSQDIITCTKQAARIKGADAAPTPLLFDTVLHAVVFARAADQPADFILHLGAADFVYWSTMGQAFFMSE